MAHPNFIKPFEIHTDASHTQLGAVIAQEGQPIAFYSRKLNPAQTRYTTTERELLAICETLKEFRNILLGYEIRVYCDHKNLTYKNFNVKRVMRWRLLIEEFGADLNYIKGENNIVADALSRLDLIPPEEQESFHHGTLLQLFTGDTIKEISDNRAEVYHLKLRLGGAINAAQLVREKIPFYLVIIRDYIVLLALTSLFELRMLST